MNWPNFFVVGAQKAGTTSLHTHLKRHPDVFLPAHKEARYFQPEHRHSWSLDRYQALYADAKGYKAIGSVTPFYLADPAVPARIREVSPDAKIIVVLRDPVERAYAHYGNYRRSYYDPASSFREALQRYDDRSAKEWHLSQEYIEDGFYHDQVRGYLETFGRNQVLVLLFDDLAKNANELLARIAAHIGVDPHFYDGLDVSEVPNPYRIPKFRVVRWAERHGLTHRLPRSIRLAWRPIFYEMKKPPLDQESRRKLQQLYDPDLARLEELLERRLPELRKSWV